jgi:hypothetical protein
VSFFYWGEANNPNNRSAERGRELSYERPVRMADYFRSVGRTPDIPGVGRDYWSERSWSRAPIERVRLDELHAAQNWITTRGLCHHARPGARPDGGELPCVLHYRGRWHLIDGHHRAITAMDRGETHFRARVKRPETDQKRGEHP